MGTSILEPVTFQTISPEKLLKMSDSERSNIMRTRFIPPQIGKRGFGTFEVEYKTPVLVEIKKYA